MKEPLFDRAFRVAAMRHWLPARLTARLFHLFWYYATDTWQQNTFLGHRILQCPFDLQIYQELIFEKRPEAIVQTGVFCGGSLLYFASLLDLIGAPADAPVIGVDVELTDDARSLQHPRIQLIEGSSISDTTVASVERCLAGRSALVILDSDHTRDHVREELRRYAHLVPVGGSLVVEDTSINGRPVLPSFGPGPYEAMRDFLITAREFAVDDRARRNRMTLHGWLTRLR